MAIAAQDAQIAVALALPVAGGTNTTGVIDLQAIAPQSDAWRLGRIVAIIPAMPNHTDSTKTITLEIQVAGASLTLSPVAPQLPIAGAFANANPRQIGGVPGLAMVGSAATLLYFTLPTDANGNTQQFIQFLQTVPAADGNVTGQTVTYAYVAG